MLFIFCINKTIVLIFILGLYLKYNIAKFFLRSLFLSKIIVIKKFKLISL